MAKKNKKQTTIKASNNPRKISGQVIKVEKTLTYISIKFFVFFFHSSADSQAPLLTPAIGGVRATTGEASKPWQTQVRAATVVGAVVKD